MITSDLKNKIIEAIASDSTSVETKILLKDLLKELEGIKTEEDLIALAIKFAELLLLIFETTGSG